MNVDVTPHGADSLLTVQDVAELLKCSSRTVYRYADGGLIPRPHKLGKLIRWYRADIEAWIHTGCKPVRRLPAKGGVS